MTDALMPARSRPTVRGLDSLHAVVGAWLHGFLLAGFIIYTFIGTRPFADASVAERVDGNPLDRVMVLALFGMALLSLALHWRAAVLMFFSNIPLFVLVSFCVLSVFWSDYPGLTFRRSLLLVFLTVIAAGIAASLTDLRRFHSWWFFGLTAVILLNLVGTVVWPGSAITDIGVRGLYPQKNVAGLVAMITMICGVTWILGTRGSRPFLLGIAMLIPTLIFLILTRSKTSIGLAGVAVVLIVGMALAERFGPRFILLAISVCLVALAGILVMFAAYNFELEAFLAATLGDPSFTGRDELWAFTFRAAQERLWFGHGYGAFWDVGLAADPLRRVEPGTWLGEVEIGTINQAHNGYLELWVHVGLPAMVLGTLIVVGGTLSGMAQIMSSALTVQARAAIGFMTVFLLFYLFHNVTEASLFMRGSVQTNSAVLFLLALSRSRWLGMTEERRMDVVAASPQQRSVRQATR